MFSRALFLSVLFALVLLEGCGTTVHRFPVAIYVDAQNPPMDLAPVKTALLLRLQMKSYGPEGVSLDSMSAADDKERALVAYLTSIRKVDMKTYRSLHFEAKNPQVKFPDETPDQPWFIQAEQKLFNGFRNVRIESRISLKDGDLFIWKVEGPKGWWRQGSCTRLVEGKIRIGDVMTGFPLEVFIVDCLLETPAGSVEKLEAPSTEHRKFALDLDPGAALEFDGEYLDAEIGDPHAKFPPPAKILHDAVLFARNGNVEGYRTCFTAQSQARWNQGQPYLRNDTGSRRVRFVMKADPLSLVFMAPVVDGSISYVSYRYVLNRNGALKIARESFEDSLDDVLREKK